MRYAVSVTTLDELALLSRLAPQWCTAVEISGELLAENKLQLYLNSLIRTRTLLVRDLMPRKLCDLIVAEHGAIRQEFIAGAHRNVRAAARLGAQTAELGFRCIPRDPARLELIRTLFGVVYDAGLKLAFNRRLPAPPGEPEEAGALEFLREMMFDCALNLDLHIHEPTYAALSPETFFTGSTGPYLNAARLIYEPALGNRIGRHQLHRLRSGAAAFDRDRFLIFAPVNVSTAALENELAAIEDILQEEEEENPSC